MGPHPAGERRRVERSLYQRANGYNYEATKIFMPAGSKQPVVVHYMEHVPADVGAAFIWLKNRDPEHWRDVQNVEHVLGKYIIQRQAYDRRTMGGGESHGRQRGDQRHSWRAASAV
jgi:hypothetical protein